MAVGVVQTTEAGWAVGVVEYGCLNEHFDELVAMQWMVLHEDGLSIVDDMNALKALKLLQRLTMSLTGVLFSGLDYCSSKSWFLHLRGHLK